MTFLPAPVDLPAFLWGGIAIRLYYRKEKMRGGRPLTEKDARRLLSGSHIHYQSNGGPVVEIPTDKIQVTVQEAEEKSDVPEQPGPQVFPEIKSFQKTTMKIIWKKKRRYTEKKWGRIGLAIFLTGTVHGSEEDGVHVLSETSISKLNMLKG